MTQNDPQNPPVVLVVEDEDVLRLDATESLISNGYRVLEARNAEEALEILKRRSDVHVLFTDVQMPGAFDGMELAKQVHRRWPQVTLLVTSGGVDLADDDIPDNGVFIPKPYRASELLETIARAGQKRWS